VLGVVLALCLGGCGGSGGGEAAEPPLPSPPPAAAANPGHVRVTVLDRSGAPLAGISVTLAPGGFGSELTRVTDATGVARFSNVRAGEWRASAFRSEFFSDDYFTARTFMQPQSGTDLELTLRPRGEEVLGISNAESRAQASVDGRQLDLVLRVVYLPGMDGLPPPETLEISMDDCQPDADNEAGVQEAECLVGEPGFDAGYQVANKYEPLDPFEPVDPADVARIPAATAVPKPFDVALLLDQSRRMAELDPQSWRWGHIEYLLRSLAGGDRVLLSAFSADDPAGSDLSLLPEQPVTLYPVGDPAFEPVGDALIASLPSLAALEGGASPLFDAFDRVRQFMTDQATPASNDDRWLVVLADGVDDTCGSRAQCLTARQAAVDALPGSGVKVVSLGVGSGPGARDLGRLAEFGYAFGLQDAWQFGVLFDRLRPLLDGTVDIYEVRFRLTSETAGAFKPGRLLLGTLHTLACPMGCGPVTDVPIAVRIQ